MLLSFWHRDKYWIKDNSIRTISFSLRKHYHDGRPTANVPLDMDPSEVPAAAPPPGQASNFVDPASKAPMVRLSIYVTLPIMLIFAILRVYARRKKRLWGADDCELDFQPKGNLANTAGTYRCLFVRCGMCPLGWESIDL